MISFISLAARQSSRPRTEPRHSQTSAEDILFLQNIDDKMS